MGKQPHGTPESSFLKGILKLLLQHLQDHSVAVFLFLLLVIFGLILRLLGLV
jgi:hypothetical protein